MSSTTYEGRDPLSHSPRGTAWSAFWLIVATLLMLFGCGGGGGDASTEAPPAFTVQPVSQAAVSGTSVTFSVTVSGSGVTLQWQRSIDAGSSWQDIAGAVAQAYTIAAVNAAMNGHQFRVAASSGSTTVLSSAVTLSVTLPAPPAITVQPADVSITAGTAASLSVTATGTSLGYQWQTSTDGVAWSDVPGATQATLALNAVALSENGRRYRVLVSNAGGTVTSSVVRLTVSPAPTLPIIATQPVAASVLVGQSVTFTVVATGNPAPSHQWQSSTDNGLTFTNIAGATGATYTIPAAQLADTGKRLRVVVSNSAGSVNSAVVVLTVAAGVAPVVTVNPAAKVAYLPNNDFVPGTATFSAAFSGTPTPTLQWQVSTDGGLNFSNVNGATAASFTTPTVAAGDDNKQFRLVATNIAGTAASNAALLTVRNAGIGGEAIGLGVRGNGEIVAAVNPFAPAFTVPNWSIPNFYGIRIVSAAGQVGTLAGNGTQGHADGTGAAATFYAPRGMVLDSAGNAYVTDLHSIRKVTPAGVVSTVAGQWNQPGFVNDTGALARFNTPTGITIDAAGDLYVVDTRNSAIRKVTPAGVVTTVAGGTFGVADGTGAAAQFMFPRGITVEANGSLLVTDTIQEGSVQGVGNRCPIRRVTPAGVVTTISPATCGGLVDGSLGTATFDLPWGIVGDALGNVFVADGTRVRMISAAGVVSTLAGSTTGSRYVSNGAIALDAAGNVYVHNGHDAQHTVDNLIRKIAPAGTFVLVP